MKMEKPLIIYTHGAGRLGNQLLAYGHFLAFLTEYSDQFDFVNFAFIPYADFLKYTSQNLSCSYPTVHNRLSILQNLAPVLALKSGKGSTSKLQGKIIVNCARLLHGYAALAPHAQSLLARDIYGWSLIAGQHLEYLDLALPETVDLFQSKAITVLAGWGIRSWDLLEKHGDAVRQALSIHPQYEAIVRRFIDNLRSQYDFLIGVAIRQGDYRSAGEIYKNFLFESDQYVRWIQQARDVFAHKGRVGFVLTADEPQNIEKFAGLNVHFATGIAGGSGHFIESLMELALCDLLITSATTFGGWAAFLGNIPILPLYEPNQTIYAADSQHYLEAFRRFDALGNKIL
jgi:hypothetical protein